MSIQTWLVTGGCGFIGSAFVKYVLDHRPLVRIVNLDALTYAGNVSNLESIEGHERYRFIHGNICDADTVRDAIEPGIDVIVNFAAETHVDRSILDPEAFLRTDVIGTGVLLEAARTRKLRRFVQVSTDEVYGQVEVGASKETDAIAPRSPYAASKAAGDLQALAYYTTYGTPVVVTRGSNTYGPFQHPEKLIPLFISNLMDERPVPVYGDGMQIRDWLHVDDHVRGILVVLERGTNGNAYNLGAGNARTNLDITRSLLAAFELSFDDFVKHVPDRPGHDRRYALDSTKVRSIGWTSMCDFDIGLAETIAWYRSNDAWWRPLRAGPRFTKYYERQYAERGMPNS